jgi:hypothetical protein
MYVPTAWVALLTGSKQQVHNSYACLAWAIKIATQGCVGGCLQAQVESLAQELSEEFYQQRAQRQRLQYELVGGTANANHVTLCLAFRSMPAVAIQGFTLQL